MEMGEEPPDEVFVDEKVLEILRESLKQKLKRDRKGSKSVIKNALKATMQEFLTCGKLIGYDLDGNVVEISFHSNKLEDNAMQNLFIQKFGEFMAGRMNISGDF
jgi:hypothetical protein